MPRGARTLLVVADEENRRRSAVDGARVRESMVVENAQERGEDVRSVTPSENTMSETRPKPRSVHTCFLHAFPPRYRYPVMDKLGTTWAPPHSISTTFRVKVNTDGSLVAASARGERIYTETCGLGWRFSMHCGSSTSFGYFITLEYDAHFAHRGLGTVQVFAGLKAEGAGENEYAQSHTRPVEPSKRAYH
jgi:hypothetical protein